jgi:PEGA domain/Curli production assembly/transport component CsgG
LQLIGELITIPIKEIMSRNRLLILVAALVCVFYTNTTDAGTGELVAVLDLDNNALLSKQEIRTLSDRLRSEIIKSGIFTVLDRSNMESVLAEHQFQMTDCVESSCKVRFGQLLGVEKLILGSVGKFAGKYTMSAQKLNIETGVTESTADELCPDLECLLNATKKVAFTITGGAVPTGGGRRTGPAQQAEVIYGKLRVATSPDGAEVYVDAEPRGRTPLLVDRVPVGERDLTIILEGYNSLTKRILVRADKITEVSEILAPETGGLIITSTPPGAKVFVGDRYYGETAADKPLELRGIQIGRYPLKLVKANYTEHFERVVVRTNDITRRDITLVGLPGRLLVTTTPSGAAVYLDGRKVGKSTFSSKITPERHKLRVVLDGYQTQSRTVDVRPNKPLTANFALVATDGSSASDDSAFVNSFANSGDSGDDASIRKMRTMKTVKNVLGIASAVGFVFGGVFYLLSGQEYQSMQSADSQSVADEHSSKGHGYENLAAVGFVVGAGGLMGALVAYDGGYYLVKQASADTPNFASAGFSLQAGMALVGGVPGGLLQIKW